MTWSIGLHLGEAVFEIVARHNDSPNSPSLKARTFLAQSTPEQAFSQFVTQNNISHVTQIEFASHLPIQIIEAGHGTPAAVLTTSGLENWLELNVATKARYFTARPRRPSLLIDREFVFGISERTNAQGHIEKLLDEAELEFLISKLELHGIKHVAICFLHSVANPENEKRAAQYLREKGYHVYTSSHKSIAAITDEKIRFWTTILNAYVSPYFLEKLTALNTEFQKVLAPEATLRFGGHNFNDVLTREVLPLETTFSFANHLGRRFARTSGLLYCGLEEFFYFKPNGENKETYKIPLCEIAAHHVEFKKIEPQPLTQLGRSFFSELAFLNKKIAFDPGPVVFGRGLVPSLFDLLSYNVESATHILGLKERMSDRGRMRLAETLTAYARSMSEGYSLSSEQLIERLLLQAKESWLAVISEDHPKHITLCGPLAPLVNKYIPGEIVGDDFFTTSSLLLTGDAK